MWIQEQKGLPVQVEFTPKSGQTIIEYKNIEFADIPDSMFELPAGVEITDMVAPQSS